MRRQTRNFLKTPRLLLATLCLLLSCRGADLPKPHVENGILDLRTWNFQEHGPVTLDGQWFWYWKKLLTPEEIERENPAPTGFYNFPSAWNGKEVNGEKISADGSGTFRLRILLPAPGRYAMKLVMNKTAYRFFLGKKEIGSNGTVGADANSTEPVNFARMISFDADSDTVDLIMQVSSFNYVNGGPRDKILFGSLDVIQEQRVWGAAITMFFFGCYLMVGLYHVILFMLRPRDSSPIYLAAFCFAVGTWSLTVGETILWRIFPEISYLTTLRVEFLAMTLMLPALPLFFRSVYMEETPLIFGRIAQVYATAVSLLILFTPAHIFSRSLQVSQIFVLIYVLLFAWVLVRVWLRKKGSLNLIAYLLFIVVVFRDASYRFMRIDTADWYPFALLALTLVQAFLISRKSSRAYQTVEWQTDILKNQARTLRETVQAYYRFVPREFLMQIGKEEITTVQLGDQVQKTMSVFFADIRSFTAISEKMSPEETFAFLNDLLGRLGPIIRKNRGFIDKYLGDGIMAIFPEQPDDALLAAVEMLEELKDLNYWRSTMNAEEIRLGIGIHIGRLMLGTVGEPERMDGTVISDAVNTASRIQEFTKEIGIDLAISETFFQSLKDPGKFKTRPLGSFRPRGRDEGVNLYEVLYLPEGKSETFG